MKRNLPTLCLLLTFSVIASISHSEEVEDPAASNEISSLIKELRELRESAKSARNNRYAEAISAFSSAAASGKSANKFYLDCVKLIEFERKERSRSELRDWEKRSENKIETTEHGLASQIQLRWLVISLKKAAGSKLEDLLPEIEQILVATSQLEKKFEDDNAGNMVAKLRESVDKTPFAKAYRVDSELGKLRGWALAPGDFNGVFRQTIMPYFRALEDEVGLAKAWDSLISIHTGRASRAKLDDSKLVFQTEALPRLQWEKEFDLYGLAKNDKRLKSLVAFLKGHISHPNAGEWIDSLEDEMRSASQDHTTVE